VLFLPPSVPCRSRRTGVDGLEHLLADRRGIDDQEQARARRTVGGPVKVWLRC